MNDSPGNAPANVDPRNAEEVLAVLRAATSSMLEDPNRTGSIVRIPARGNLLATGDLHDNPMHLARVIELAKLDRSPDNHVVVHELIHGERLVNGLALSYRMLVKVAKLQLDHPGQVHALLANHELSQMAGHPVSKGGSDMTANFDEGVDWVFGEDAEEVSQAIRDFVLAMPLALLTGNGIMCSHSLPGPSQMARFDMDIIERPLEADEVSHVDALELGEGLLTQEVALGVDLQRLRAVGIHADRAVAHPQEHRLAHVVLGHHAAGDGEGAPGARRGHDAHPDQRPARTATSRG